MRRKPEGQVLAARVAVDSMVVLVARVTAIVAAVATGVVVIVISIIKDSCVGEVFQAQKVLHAGCAKVIKYNYN